MTDNQIDGQMADKKIHEQAFVNSLVQQLANYATRVAELDGQLAVKTALLDKLQPQLPTERAVDKSSKVNGDALPPPVAPRFYPA